MKELKDLKGTYGSNDISDLVAFAQDAPVMLQDDQNYHLDKCGTIVHIYGSERGIEEYKISCAGDYVSIGNVSATKSGIEIDVKAVGIDKIILHNEAYSKTASETIARRTERNFDIIGESCNSGMCVNSGESRGEGESRSYARQRKNAYSGGESRGWSGGESRGRSGGGSESYSGGESRGRSGGESRW